MGERMSYQYVLLKCGHWFYESGVRHSLSEDTHRACGYGHKDDAYSYEVELIVPVDKYNTVREHH